MSDDAPEWSCGDPDCAACLNRAETEQVESDSAEIYKRVRSEYDLWCKQNTGLVIPEGWPFGAVYKGERVVQTEYSDMGPAPMLSDIE